jgi:ABC-type proline/glycine betaine transport system permease subunit
MAVTGEDYIDSAKSALSLIFDNFMLFYIIDLVGGLIKFAGIIFICALPGVIGFFILKGTAENPEDTNYLTFGTLIIVLIAILIGTVFLSVLS